MQRIALMVHSFPTLRLAGTELYVARLARHLAADGLDLDIVYPVFDSRRAEGDVRSFSWHGVTVLEINLLSNQDLEKRYRDEQAARQVTELLLARKIGLAHFNHLIGFTGAALETCAKAGIRIMLTAHDGWLVCEQTHLLRADGRACPDGPQENRLCASCLARRWPDQAGAFGEDGMEEFVARRRAYLRQAAGLADMILAPSRFMARLLTRQGFKSSRLKYSPLGLDSPRNAPGRKRRADRLRLGFFGNLIPVKGIDLILEAMALLDPRLVTLDIHGGSFTPGVERAVSKALEGWPNIRMHGRYEPSEMPGLLAAIDLALVPSRMESYSFVARECLLEGVPVIATRTGALPEIILEGKTGWLVPPEDSAALTAAIRHVLAHPEELARMPMKSPGVETSSAESRRLIGFYSEILGKGQGAESDNDPGFA